ncbi:hypothetical protein HY637_02715 [Candidatus Woesearchaeota archaeon]|nr:hypothetical protein [Candidatus Woesearchaeota archaeon]
MDFAIIASSKDPAGINIRNSLIKLFDFEKTDEKYDGNEVYQNINIKLYLTNDELVYSENIDKRINADFLIFASKHRSKENTPSFAVHAIGNWNEARLGGKEKMLCLSSAVLLKNMFLELNENAKDTTYEITLEATHHGPYVEKPAVFVEIGSTEKEWNEKNNGEIIAKAIMKGLENDNKNYKIAAGLGGTHYCANFNKIMLKTDIAFSHICPKYALQDLDEDLTSQILSRTKEKIDFFVLDWKGLGAEKERIGELLKGLNIEMIRADRIGKS